MSENVLRLDHVTMQFGGVVAVNDLSMEVNDGRDRCPHRSQRRRQDHGFQLHNRRI